jgi:hypothetical protein
MLYFYKDELEDICKFLDVDLAKVLAWCELNERTNQYIEFRLLSQLGQEICRVIYGYHYGTDGIGQTKHVWNVPD